ncbi:MAG: hypothetical protein HY363_04060 [Candidatus Aenigmarchaeota archaeon]|nr:hypothetical protein [Candidatus Aenigmarchaeota archaeon]
MNIVREDKEIDSIVLKITEHESILPNETLRDEVIVRIKLYAKSENVFTANRKLAIVHYLPSNYRNTHHALKLLSIKPYYRTSNYCPEDIDFRILANIMKEADKFEQERVHVTIKRTGNIRKKLYQTGQPEKEEILKEAKERKIRLPAEMFYD